VRLRVKENLVFLHFSGPGYSVKTELQREFADRMKRISMCVNPSGMCCVQPRLAPVE
jgi:hypothetical protein